MMITRTLVSVAVLGALSSFLPNESHAFGLGNIELSSALNQPFKAEIPVTALRADEVTNLQVQLASNKEFERAGLERSFLLTQFEFDIVEKNGQTTVLIHTKQPVKEPFVDFLVTATTGTGRMIREYTVLLDPPKNMFTKETGTSTQSLDTEESSNGAMDKTTKGSQTSPKARVYDVDKYGPTERHDTLWQIALTTKPQESISVHQMMMALLDANPNAFTRNNINGLKAGYTLTMPTLAEINQLSTAQAISAVKQQNSLWKNRNTTTTAVKSALPSTVADSSMSDLQDQDSATKEKINDTQVTVTQENDARLELVAPSAEQTLSDQTEMSPLGSDQIEQLSEQLTLAQETIEAQTQENIDIKARMAAMEEQIQTLRRLISLKDTDLARLQSSLQQEGGDDSNAIQSFDAEDIVTESNDESDAAVESTQQQTSVSEDNQNQDEATDELINDNVPANDMESVVNEDSKQSSVPMLNDVVNYTANLTGIDQREMQSYLDRIKALINQHKTETMLGGLLALLILWLIIRRINRPDITWDEALKKMDGKSANTDDAEIHTDDQEIAVQVDDEDEIVKTVDDLINDADIYVSYGDFVKAKLTLQEAYNDEPDNEEVLHKLLFVLFKQQQKDEFVTFAQQYHDDTNASLWEQVVDWGQQLAPEYPLFEQPIEQSEDVTSIESTTLDELNDFNEVVEPIEDHVVEQKEPDQDDELLAFNPGLNEKSTIEITDTDNALVLDDLNADDAPLTLTIENNDATLEDEIDDSEINDEADDNLDNAPIQLDLSSSNDDEALELDSVPAKESGILDITTDQSDDSDELEFDLSGFDQVDEAETKLDLAAAYVDMGDPDGAKNILEEVMVEGNDDQIARAQALLKELD